MSFLFSFTFFFKVKKDIPPSAVTRPIFGILGTIHLVAGKKNELKWGKTVIKSTLLEYKDEGTLYILLEAMNL